MAKFESHEISFILPCSLVSLSLIHLSLSPLSLVKADDVFLQMDYPLIGNISNAEGAKNTIGQVSS